MKRIFLALVLAAIAGGAAAQERAPAPTQFVLEETVSLAPAVVLGDTPEGRRQVIPITGGTFVGRDIRGEVLAGGGDYQLVRSDGSVRVDAEYYLRTDDGVVIHVHNVGVIYRGPDAKAPYLWASPSFDAPKGRYGWLNQALFVSQIVPAGDPQHPAVKIVIYRVG